MKTNRRQKYLAKDTREYILVSCVFNGETWLHDFGRLAVSYISDIPFEQLDDGYTTECIIGMIFVTWCIIKLDCYLTLCRSCHILILDNNISYLGSKLFPVAGELGV